MPDNLARAVDHSPTRCATSAQPTTGRRRFFVYLALGLAVSASSSIAAANEPAADVCHTESVASSQTDRLRFDTVFQCGQLGPQTLNALAASGWRIISVTEQADNTGAPNGQLGVYRRAIIQAPESR